jgi:hypothetical protein
VPTYTLAGLGGISATFLSGTSGISYNSTTGVISYSGTVYTDASIRALLSGGTGISYNSSTGAISYSGTVYTDSSVRALISMTTTGDSGASTYNNTTGVINVPNYTLAGLGGISYTSLSGGTGITYNNTTGAISYSGTVYTDASVRALISATGNISYNSTTGVISTSLTQYTDALARASVSITTTGTSGASTYNSTTGVFNIPQYASAFSGTNNYVAKFTSSTTIGNSLIQDNGTGIGIGIAASSPFILNTLLTDATTNSVIGIMQIGRASSGTASNGIGGNIQFTAQDTAGTQRTAAYITWKLAVASSASPQGYLSIGTRNASEALIFVDSGAATFSSSVSATNVRSSGVGTFGFNTANNGEFQIYATAVDGMVMSGRGSSYDMIITNKSGSDVFRIPTGTTTANFAGNVGIGTSSPSAKLQVEGSSNPEIRVFQTGESRYLTLGKYYIYTTGEQLELTAAGAFPIIFNTNATERMRITSAGSVCVSTTTASFTGTNRGNITIGGTASALLAFQVGGTGKAYLYYDGSGTYLSDASGGLIDISSTSQGLRITAGGNNLMGTTSDNGERLYVSGAIRATGTITANSDITLKKNLLKIENALEKVEQINGYTYEFKADDSKRHAGVIAQEIQTVLPEIVNKGNDGILGVEYGNISALLIEAIKEQNIKIKNLETLLASK